LEIAAFGRFKNYEFERTVYWYDDPYNVDIH
jgi:hypothetical protein